MNFWLTVLASAAVGALVSSVATLLGQYFERRARREELLLRESLALAADCRKFTLEIAEKTGATATLIDPAINAETYYRWLKSILETGKLPADADKGRPKSK